MKKLIVLLMTGCFLCAAAGSAMAVKMTIGDIDGFGFESPNTYQSAQDTPPDSDGDGRIEPGEFLPDLDNSGGVNISSDDEFDNRSAAEAGASNGAQFTDISLQNDDFSPQADEAIFTFNFLVPSAGEPDYGIDHFINFIFGDFDVSPADIEVDGATQGLTQQEGDEDGLVQLAFANVPWSDMEDGEVTIDLNAPNEPYLAVDYALLDTEVGTGVTPVPEPTTWLLFGLGLLGLAGVGRKKLLRKG
jgi:hypothetical protein